MSTDPDQDWLDAEPPLSRATVTELQRLKRRAKSRLVLVLALATAMTAALVYKVATRPRHYRARIVLAVQEGDVERRETPLPMRDLRAYVTTVLMPAADLTAMVEQHDLFPLRRTQGDEFALTELWDVLDVSVHRNYFLYDDDTPRDARIAITVNYLDPDLSYAIARDVASIVMRNAALERERAARSLIDEADRAVAASRARLVELETEAAALRARAKELEAKGKRGLATALAGEAAAVETAILDARESAATLARASSTEQLTAAIYQAGLGLDLSIVDERKPDRPVDTTYLMTVIAVILFLITVVIVSLFVGAFDSRVHDLDDVVRLGIPIVGEIPPFPGDGVGSLRDRGVKRRGVALSWRA
jgi:hypothetical protein